MKLRRALAVIIIFIYRFSLRFSPYAARCAFASFASEDVMVGRFAGCVAHLLFHPRSGRFDPTFIINQDVVQ